MVHLIHSRITYNAWQIAELMFKKIYKLHSLPKHIISDHNVLFTSIFWGHLHKLMGTKLKMSSAYHPETDGLTERANHTIMQMLHQCINEKPTDWVSKLPVIEFAINSAHLESTGYTPFFLNTRWMPKSLIWDSACPDEYSTVWAFALQRKLALISAHDSILAACVKQTCNANRKRQLPPFKENDLVYLSTKNITFLKGLAQKLIPKFIRPYKILRDFKNQSFLIDLPAHLKQRGMHSVFHVALLWIHIPNDKWLFPGWMNMQLALGKGSEGEWAVDKILLHSGSGEESIFLIKWKAGDITWLLYYQITHLDALPIYLDLLGVDSISNLPKGQGTPPKDDSQIFIGSISLQTTFKPHLRTWLNHPPLSLICPKILHQKPSPLAAISQQKWPPQKLLPLLLLLTLLPWLLLQPHQKSLGTLDTPPSHIVASITLPSPQLQALTPLTVPSSCTMLDRSCSTASQTHTSTRASPLTMACLQAMSSLWPYLMPGLMMSRWNTSLHMTQS